MKLHTKIWIGIGVFTFIVCLLLYIFVVRGILVGYGPADTPPRSVGNNTVPGITVPAGFHIAYYAENVTNARSLVRAEQDTLFVSTRDAGNVYAVRDTNNDGYAETMNVVAQGLTRPNGIAYAQNTLYITTIHEVLAMKNIMKNLENPSQPMSIYQGLPDKPGHDWRYTAIGPDNKLYLSLGAPCNACNEGDPYATIARMDTDGTHFEIFASGIRNSIGFDWNPVDDSLWFTDNGRDWLGDDLPPDELNHAPTQGLHFGFPFCHGEQLVDDEFNPNNNCEGYQSAALSLGPHVAALGMRFSESAMFPEYYRGGIFIAEHGSWNRQDPIGYRIMYVPFKDGKPAGYEVFAEGWLQGSSAWGRPVDVEFLSDGSLIISDDRANALYRITYSSP